MSLSHKKVCYLTKRFAKNDRLCEQCQCSICAELRGTSTPLFKSFIPAAAASRVLQQNNEWALLPTLGPLTPGHLMLVPREHYYSILACSEETLSTSRELLNACSLKLAASYGQEILFFEHGATAESGRSCGACIDHAHLHIVPGPSSFLVAAMSEFEPWVAADSLGDLQPYAAGHPYLLIGSLTTAKCWLYRCSRDVPSQFLRRVLGDELKNRSWDWRKEPNAAAFFQTLTDWRA
jgi:diadenosine tetraphosphate (Ap4A) HIT family hydrolase